MENKVNINQVLSGLKDTAGMLNIFLNQTMEQVPQEQKDSLDKEFKKAQSDLSNIVNDINNIKL